MVGDQARRGAESAEFKRMKLGSGNTHLTYCLNVHPAETWEDTFESIRTCAVQVRDLVAPGVSFGLGLRISHIAAVTLGHPAKLAELKAFLKENNLYVFTINGFPYGPFHGVTVKQDVYKPDWRMDERVEYTLQLADILAELLPDGMSGSISTVPCSYKSWIKGTADRELMIKNLIKCVRHLQKIEAETGKEIHIGLEPEPDCYLETTDEVLDFFSHDALADEGVRRHLGVCFDTCHLAVEYEDLCEALDKIVDAGILVSKIQISSALKRDIDDGCQDVLSQFNDDVYLHQVKSRGEDGVVVSSPDLNDFFNEMPEGDCRVHCHVPLYFEGNDDVGSTASELTREFFGKVAEYGIEHLEIETYTFDVLPEDLKKLGVVGSIVKEYEWVVAACGR